MIILKLAALTCVFYLVIAAMIEAGIHLWVTLGKGGMIGLKGLPFVVFFGIAWLISFSLAARIISSSMAIKPPP